MSEILNNTTRGRLVRGTLAFVLGTGIGLAIETHTDTVARKKINTVEVCKKIDPLIDGVVSDAFHGCLVNGVPHGAKIDKGKITVGQPAARVDTYETAQHNEQGIEPERLILWGAIGIVVAAV